MTPTIDSIFSARRIKPVLCALALIAMAALAASAGAWLRHPRTQELSARAAQDSHAAQEARAKRRGPVQTVRFALYDAGIYPQEVRAQKGAVSIAMEDLSGGTEGLIVERRAGNAPERIAHVPRGQRYGRGKETLELTPGTYEVWDASRPDNRATLIIEP
jgi:hypothetical protein